MDISRYTIGDCNNCSRKGTCAKRAGRSGICDFHYKEQKGRCYATPGNPCLDQGLLGISVGPLSILDVKGEPLFGDGGHRKWKAR